MRRNALIDKERDKAWTSSGADHERNLADRLNRAYGEFLVSASYDRFYNGVFVPVIKLGPKIFLSSASGRDLARLSLLEGE